MSLTSALDRHPHARAVLESAVPPAGNPSHAYLFHGPAGSGKASAARAFAAELLAEGSPDPDGTRARVLRGAHPDLTWVVPTGAAVMRRADIEEPVVGAASRTPFEAQRRVFVLEGVDTMNDEAANRMLKTLEEPPSFAHLVLLTDRPGDVLPTIASRCQPVRFDAPPPEVIEASLSSRVQPETAKACSRLALGDGDRALALALGEGPALRAAAEAYARGCLSGDLTKSPWTALLERAKTLGDTAQGEVEEQTKADAEVLPQKERKRAEREGADAAKRAGRRARTRTLDEALLLTELWLRDVACVVDGAEDVVHATDRLDALRADAEGRNVHRLRSGIGLVDETRAALTVNVTEELALEALAYRLVPLLAVSD